MIHSNSSRTGRDSFAEQRELTQLAAKAKSPEEISKLLGRPSTTIRRLALRLGIRLKQTGAPR